MMCRLVATGRALRLLCSVCLPGAVILSCRRPALAGDNPNRGDLAGKAANAGRFESDEQRIRDLERQFRQLDAQLAVNGANQGTGDH